MARNNHNFGMDMALEAAKHSELRIRVGASCEFTAVWNERKTHPKLREWGYPEWANIHAEMALVLALGMVGLNRKWVYVARLTRAGEWALARPCPCCMALLLHSGARGVRWTVKPGRVEEVKF